ncbi:MAG: flagellar hook protein FlgE [Deltaproteobacteria bacterium]|nr:flagellar hook protein FlgE [Deltaproteobacteria bacterium]
MSISSAMYTGLSGLSSNGEAMAVVGDNIANLNTTGFKYSAVHFEDLMAQMISTGSGPGQVGRGAQISEISTCWKQGALETSADDVDVAITGTGFLIVKDSMTQGIYYTRDGNFHLDKNGYLINAHGYRVQGKVINQATRTPMGVDTDIVITQNFAAPQPTSIVDMVMNLDSNTLAGGNYISSLAVYDSQGNTHTLQLTYTKDPGTAEVSQVTCGADVAGSLNSTYWNLSSPTTNFYVWYNVGGAGVDPAIAGRTGIQVNIAAGATADQVAAATQAVLDARADFACTAAGPVLTITNETSGVAAAPTDGTTGWGAGSFTEITPGVNPLPNTWIPTATLDGMAVIMTNPDGTPASNIVFDNNGTMTSLGQYHLDLTAFNIGDPTTGVTTLNLKNTGGGSTTQYAASSVTNYASQDGYGPGFLQRLSINNEGIITGHYSNGQVIPHYQLTLARFNAPGKLYREGSNLYTETQDSGVALTGAPGTNGLGKINSNALEQSNVDLGNEFVHMILYQRAFQANSRIITTADSMLEEVLSLKR